MGLVLSVNLQGKRVFHTPAVSAAGAAVFAGALVALWIAMPHARRRRKHERADHADVRATGAL